MKNIDTVNCEDGSKTYAQYKQVFTAAQMGEMNDINEYRDEADTQNVALDSELCAAANRRAYVNAHDNYEAHDWANQNNEIIQKWLKILDSQTFSENTATRRSRHLSGYVNSIHYKGSPAYYKAMVDVRFNFTGISHTYFGDDSSSQFDVFVPDLTTPTHGK